ncbi:MAG: hypothetical protein ACLQVN_11900 [Bryobacteraceae bacterium]
MVASLPDNFDAAIAQVATDAGDGGGFGRVGGHQHGRAQARGAVPGRAGWQACAAVVYRRRSV